MAGFTCELGPGNKALTGSQWPGRRLQIAVFCGCVSIGPAFVPRVAGILTLIRINRVGDGRARQAVAKVVSILIHREGSLAPSIAGVYTAQTY